jgi:CDP-2,3-bis-(O-geranylgeranyl)-sn-glycerol synthase
MRAPKEKLTSLIAHATIPPGVTLLFYQNIAFVAAGYVASAVPLSYLWYKEGEEILNLILSALWFILPAYFANASALLFGKVFFKGKWPIDFNKKFFDNQPILGSGKTWPGFFGGLFVGTVVGVLQGSLLIGFLLSLGALLGDFVKSFFKRRLKIARGRPWPPADQLDFVIGALLLVSIVQVPNWKIIITLLVITPLIHLSANVIAFLLKLKKEWY